MFEKPETGIEEIILVADPDPENITLVKTAFRESGVKVEGTDSGQHCIEMAKSKKPLVVLLDAGMPDLDGFDVCMRIKSNPKTQNILVVLFVKDRDADTIGKVFDAGGSDFIEKPFHLLELKARVTMALSHAKALKKQDPVGQLKTALESSGDICHELNQPLQYMLGVLQLLQMDVEKGHPAHDPIERLMEKTMLMGEISKRLMMTIRSV